MIWKGNGVIKLEKDEPALRSCWECNPAHEHLKKTDWLHLCFICGRYWILGKYMDEFDDDVEIDDFFKSLNMAIGDSTYSKEK